MIAALAAVEVVSGLGVMILDVTCGALLAVLVPGELRSRVMGAYMLVNFGTRPVGALLGGALGSACGLRPALAAGAVVAVLAVAWLPRSAVLRRTRAQA